MAVANFKSTGTRSTGAGLNADPDDWSDAGCFAPTAANIATLCNTLEAEASAEMVFDDETIVIDAAWSLNNFNPSPVIPLTIKSRSGGTVLQSVDATTRIFQKNNTSGTPQFIFEDITFSGANLAAWTANDAVLLFSQDTASVTLTDCTWKDWTFTGAIGQGPLLRIAGNAAAVTVTLTDCAVINVTHTSTENDGLFKLETNGAHNHVWTFDGLTLRRIRMTASTLNNQGVIYHANTGTATVNDLVASDLVFSAATNGQSNGGIFKQEASAGTGVVNTATVSDVIFDGDANSQGLFRFTGASSTMDGVTVSQVNRSGNITGNCIGCLATSANATADLVVQDCSVTDCHGFYGMGGYNTNGGVITLRRVRVKTVSDGGQPGDGGTNMEGLAFYSGGDGDSTWEGCLADGVTGLGSRQGLGVYTHHVDRNSDTTKTSILRNCTFTNIQSASGFDACNFKIGYALATHTVTIDNCLFDNGADDINIDENAGTLNLTMRNCHITEGAGAVTDNVVAGTTTLNSPTSGDPLLDSVGAPTASTPDAVETGGLEWWTGVPPVGVDGEPFPSWDITIGAVQSQRVPNHPVNL